MINNKLAIESEKLKDLEKGFPTITKVALNYYDASVELLEEAVYYDEDESYTYGKWFMIPIKGILSPCNNWF